MWRGTGAGPRAGGQGAGWGGALAVVSLLLFGCGGSSGTSSTGLALETCSVDGVSARCGTAMVPEDRLGGGGRQIPIRVVVIPEDRVAALLGIAQAYPQSAGTGPGETQMLAVAIRCNEAWAEDDPSKLVGTDSFEYERDMSSAQWWRAVCALIPKAGDAAATPKLTKSNVPVLAFNGEEDPQDPPGNMAAGRGICPNSLELTVPGQGHDVDPISAACEIPLIKSFIDHGEVTGLDTTCLSQLPLPAFDLTLPST